MIARSRDPRLVRMKQNSSNSHTNLQQTIAPPSMSNSSITKSLPRIPKFSHANNKLPRDNDERNRDPRSRRNKDREELKSSKSPSSKDKSKSSSKSPSSSTRSIDRKKSGSSDDSSPRKKSEDERKSKSSHHRSSHSGPRSSQSPTKPSLNNELPPKDVDLRIIPGMEEMKPDSTTSHVSKSNKDKLLNDLLNGEERKSSQTMTSEENGKENKLIFVVTIFV